MCEGACAGGTRLHEGFDTGVDLEHSCECLCTVIPNGFERQAVGDGEGERRGKVRVKTRAPIQTNTPTDGNKNQNQKQNALHFCEVVLGSEGHDLSLDVWPQVLARFHHLCKASSLMRSRAPAHKPSHPAHKWTSGQGRGGRERERETTPTTKTQSQLAQCTTGGEMAS